MEKQFVADVLRLTNEFRAKNGRAPLTANAELDATAAAHSKDMAEQDYFSHTGKDGSKPWDRAEDFGYEARSMGENIAAGQRTPEQVVQGWINSPGHRANLLNTSYTELGVGYYLLENDTGQVNYQRYWTQVFGSGDRNPASNLPGSAPSPTPAPAKSTPEPKSEPVPAASKTPAPAPKPTGQSDPAPESMPTELNNIKGTLGGDRLRGTAGGDRIQGLKGRDHLYGEAGNDTLKGGFGSDWLKGGAGRDVLIGAGSDKAGAGERDILSGGAGADKFVLGNKTAAFYSSGYSKDSPRGDDFAAILDFDAAAGDTIQLHGDRGDYRLGMISSGGTVGIFLTTGGGDELVGAVRNGGNLSLDSSAVTFVG
ncbi:MAG: CAP domain-containing protein [Cyanobacteria bacterium P01_A01_bin.135]